MHTGKWPDGVPLIGIEGYIPAKTAQHCPPY